MVNVWRPRPGEASIVTSILALRLANRGADGLIGATTEACRQASSNSVGMSDEFMLCAGRSAASVPRGNDCGLYPNYCDWNPSAGGLTLVRLRLY
jgi:hypothetical protein